jgi:ABC-type bacteriocin/lantibiotic exporter with double-glycine peptidase domain
MNLKFIRSEVDKILKLKNLIWSVISRKDKKWLYLTILGQTFLSIFDAFGILMVGVLFSISTSEKARNSLLGGIDFLQSASTFQIQIWLYLIIIFSLSLRSIGSLALNRFTLLKLSSLQSNLSSLLLSQIQLKNSSFIQRHSIQEISQFLTGSTNALFLGVIANTMIVLAEVILFVIYMLIFLFINPFLASITAVVFLVTGFLSQRVLGNKSKNLLAKQIQQTVIARDTINDAILMLDENMVSKKQDFFSSKFFRAFSSASDSYAKAVFTNLIPKFVFEMILVVTGILILVVSSWNTTASQKSFFIIFLSASSRLLPSIMKIQAGLMSIYASLGMSFGFQKFDSDLNFQNIPSNIELKNSKHQDDLIRIPAFSLGYMESQFTIDVPELVIEKNQLTFFFGPSGSGKSTIIKSILGLKSSDDAYGDYVGPNLQDHFDSIYFVGQNTHLLKESIRMNITLQSDEIEVDMHRLTQAVADAGLAEFLDALPLGINTKVTEVGSNLSGGQLQRIGLARAFYSQAQLLVFDEPTSAMDRGTENQIIRNIVKRALVTTVIVISHQEEFLRYANRSYKVAGGKVWEQQNDN